MFRLINELIDDIVWPAVMLMAIWIIFLFNINYSWGLLEFGIQPGIWEGLVGVIVSPFLHVDINHIFSNSVPFFVASAFTFHFFRKIAWRITLIIWFFAGFGVWLFATPGPTHVGASGIVYGLVAFMMTTGIIRKNRQLMAVSMLLVFLYGSMVWGVFPQISPPGEGQISWQGHLSGAITGLTLAFFYRNEGPQDDSYFDDEDDDDDDDDVFWSRDYFEQEDFKINYKYRSDDESLNS